LDRKKGEIMKVNKKLMIIAVFLLVLNMVIATQYAVTKVAYEYYIRHPSDADIRFIGSDNSTDGKRMLRIAGDNITNFAIKIYLGNFSSNQTSYFSAAFGIVNEESHELNITHINVSSINYSYMKIWLHGDRDANANNTTNDPSTVLMWDNNTMVNTSNTTAWTLAAGNSNTSDMCANVSNRPATTILTPWDNISHVRYSLNNTDAVSGISDFVWIQVGLDIPNNVDLLGLHGGTIWIHLETDTQN
jgi:hypothetical protein